MLAGAAGLLLALSPSATRADIVTVTITGTVLSGTDTSGLFGAAGGDLSDRAYSLVYRFDTSLGNTRSEATFTDLYGGTNIKCPVTGCSLVSPLLDSVLTINNQSFSFNGDGHSEYYVESDGSFSELYVQAFQIIGRNGIYSDILNHSGTLLNSSSIASSFSHAMTPDDFVDSRFCTAGGFDPCDGSYGTLGIGNVGVSVPGPVAGAGLPGLIAACAGLLAWWRQRRDRAA